MCGRVTRVIVRVKLAKLYCLIDSIEAVNTRLDMFGLTASFAKSL
jgi:hypothetical protein